MGKYLDPKNDFIFKNIFGVEKHKHLLIGFLNAILPVDEEKYIKDLEYLSPEQVPEVPGFKYTIVDVKCKANDGTFFIVEMQLNLTLNFMDRVLLNAGKVYVTQLKENEPFSQLLPVFAVNILNYIYDKESDQYYHYYKIINVLNPKMQIKGLEFLFIELPKFQPSNFTEKKTRALWLRFMNISGGSDTIPEDLLENKEIAEATKIIERSAYSVAELEAYEIRLDQMRVQQDFVEGAFELGTREGRREGRREGKREGLQEALQKLIANGMDEESAKKILDI